MKTINPAVQNACPYEVGDILTTKNSKLPSERWPGTTWAAISDRFLLGQSASYPAGSTGGQSEINLQHSHSTENHTLTVAEIPSHSHSSLASYRDTGAKGQWGAPVYQVAKEEYSAQASYEFSAGGGGAHNHGNTSNALSAAQSIMPPYTSVYIWERTA